MPSRSRYVDVLQHVRIARPDIRDPVSAIARRLLLVDGRIVTNPRSLVRSDAPVVLRRSPRPRGATKLSAALDRFGVSVDDRTCIDIGASSGGFTRVLLERGARRVYAVDVGYGQLRGDLRNDLRVVALERTNVADLPRRLPPDVVVDLVTMDLSYLPVAEAVPQLDPLRFAADAELIALVKPQYELGLAAPPVLETELERALAHAVAGVGAARTWTVTATMPSPVLGRKGAHERLLRAVADQRRR